MPAAATTPLLALADIREIAESHGYKEIGCNQASRVLSFRDGSTRINVYYTTGTVGTCLNHPKHGKTQLFRRNVSSIDALDVIFDNPRVHTGVGYYSRRNIRQYWKKVGSQDEFLCDSARRWMFVANAIGLVNNNERELKTIVEICSEWDALYWEPGDLPDLHEVKYSCGSHGGLLKMLYQVVQETCGDFETCNKNEAQDYLLGEMSRFQVDTEVPYKHECANLAAFMEDHSADVIRLKHKFMSLRKDIRIELAQWFLGRDVCGFVFTNPELQQYRTKYSNAARQAHEEYGEIMYPRSANLCACCGVLESS